MSTTAARDRRAAGLVILLGAGIIPSINTSSLNVALTDIARDLGASTADLQWIVNAYTLGYVGLMLCAAMLGDRLGRKRSLLLSLVALLVASVSGALATTPTALIACRTLMGVAAAMVQPMSLSLLSNLYPEPRLRARAFSCWAGAASVGLAVGPIVGGLLLQHFWWGAVFLANGPILLGLIVGVVLFVPDTDVRATGRWDLVGMALSVSGLAALIWAIIEAPERGWSDPGTIAAMAAGTLLLAAFLVWERSPDHDLLELSVLRDPRVSAAMAAVATVTFAFGGLVLTSGILLRSVLGYTPLRTGAALVPLALAMIVLATLSPRVTATIGANRTVALGAGIMVLACLTFATMEPTSGYWHVLVGTCFVGGGFGLANSPIIESIMTAIPHERAALASALNLETRQVGNAIGVAVLGSLLSATYRADLGRAGPAAGMAATTVTASKESIAAALALAAHRGGHAGAVLAAVATDAFAHGVRVAGYVGGAVAAIGAILALRFLPGSAPREDVDGVALDQALALASTDPTAHV